MDTIENTQNSGKSKIKLFLSVIGIVIAILVFWWWLSHYNVASAPVFVPTSTPEVQNDSELESLDNIDFDGEIDLEFQQIDRDLDSL
ncbi:MAG: hypothetical protein COV30_00045 [Candidatus Yanofskybacteria bacterium CG10_big_fil_rev_8_21_14_0_10_37_15]|uniref:Uncharacterized protein n=1 Tax=Candidatus Yanofskybacteria bacterium CG10_big_fil_rev_8_21_14_0_10_37_15 TaxID=1975097 RepID=A0A2H0R6H6_9BACT|nr:MAG: hypothetical protein COV30_00045 [Candidatus Yanofskybacteria bacterium CG10_big_fil_rev_8_21_14_0_10_37_15]